MSKTFAAHLDLEKHQTPARKHRELIIVFLIRYSASIFDANKVNREKEKNVYQRPLGKNIGTNVYLIGLSLYIFWSTVRRTVCEEQKQQTQKKLLSSTPKLVRGIWKHWEGSINGQSKGRCNENVILPNEKTVLTFSNCFANILTAGKLYYITEETADKTDNLRRPLG